MEPSIWAYCSFNGESIPSAFRQKIKIQGPKNKNVCKISEILQIVAFSNMWPTHCKIQGNIARPLSRLYLLMKK